MTLSRHSPLIVLADFSGSSSAPIAARKICDVDVDTVDAAIHALSPEVALDLPFCPSLEIRRYMDLHPDELIQRVPSLHLLAEARDEVADPRAMMEILADAGVSFDDDPAASRDGARGSAESSARHETEPVDVDVDEGGLLDSMLADDDVPLATLRRQKTPFDRMIEAIAAEAGGGRDFASEDARRDAIDAELARRLRAILAHPAFRRVEESWRSIREIVRAGPGRRVWLFDVRADEFAADAGADADERVIAKTLAAQTAHLDFDDALVIYAHSIDIDDDGLRTCEALGDLARALGKDVLAGANGDSAIGREAQVVEWVAALSEHTRQRLALATPGVLQRLPYGEETDEIETFAFEELVPEPAREDHVFSGAAFAATRALAHDLEVGERTGVLEPLPIHITKTADGRGFVGPTSHGLGEADVRNLNEAGLIAIAAVAHQDSARVVGLRTLAGRSLYDPAPDSR